MSQEKIKVLVVDDHLVVRGGIKYLLQVFKDIQLVGEAESGEQALAMCPELQPDVVLMDVKMGGMGGVETTRAVRQTCPQVQVIALSSFHEKDLIEAMMQAGAIGYLLKNVSGQELAHAIRLACEGESTYAPQVTQTLLNTTAEPDPLGVTLTNRQQAALQLVAQGLSNAEIARRLNISHHTARYHVSAMLAKLGASNRAEAVSRAARLGLVND